MADLRPLEAWWQRRLNLFSGIFIASECYVPRTWWRQGRRHDFLLKNTPQGGVAGGREWLLATELNTGLHRLGKNTYACSDRARVRLRTIATASVPNAGDGGVAASLSRLATRDAKTAC